MHTTKIGGTTFVHNGAYDGGVRIVRANNAIDDIPFEDLREFVAHYVRGNRIAQLENMSDEAVLGVDD